MRERRSQIADIPVVIPNEARGPGFFRGRRTPGFLVAFAPRNHRGCVCQHSFWRRALVLGAVLSLAISVATRYSTVVRHKAATKILTSQSLDAKRQHLLKDGLHWSAPAATFVLFEPTQVLVAGLPAVPLGPQLYAPDFLYSRPPPSR
jgi:hypothetical protein